MGLKNKRNVNLFKVDLILFETLLRRGANIFDAVSFMAFHGKHPETSNVFLPLSIKLEKGETIASTLTVDNRSLWTRPVIVAFLTAGERFGYMEDVLQRLIFWLDFMLERVDQEPDRGKSIDYILLGDKALTLTLIGLLLQNGLSLLEALEIAQTEARNDITIKFLVEIRDEIKEGISFDKSKNIYEYFGPIVTKLLDLGSKSDDLGTACLDAAGYLMIERSLLQK